MPGKSRRQHERDQMAPVTIAERDRLEDIAGGFDRRIRYSSNTSTAEIVFDTARQIAERYNGENVAEFNGRLLSAFGGRKYFAAWERTSDDGQGIEMVIYACSSPVALERARLQGKEIAPRDVFNEAKEDVYAKLGRNTDVIHESGTRIYVVVGEPPASSLPEYGLQALEISTPARSAVPESKACYSRWLLL